MHRACVMLRKIVMCLPDTTGCLPIDSAILFCA